MDISVQRPIYYDRRSACLSPDLSKDTQKAVMAACEKYHIFGTLEGAKCSYFRNHDIDFHPHYGFMIQAFELEPEMPHEFSWDNADSCEKIIVFGGEGSDVPGF